MNLSHIASERGSQVKIASTYRRLQRFFQHVAAPDDWAARLIVALLGVRGPWLLCLDRTNWQVGVRHVNILVLAQVDAPPPGAADVEPDGWAGQFPNRRARSALMKRYLAIFGAGSVEMLLADREFIGDEWLRFLKKNNIPFPIRLKANMVVIAEGGQRLRLSTLLQKTRSARSFTAALPGRKGEEPLTLGFAAKRLKGGELLIVAASRDAHHALTLYRKRWSIECLFADAKTRGLNLEDTRITSPRKLALLMAIIAIAMAWSSKIGTAVIGRAKQPRKAHGYAAKSWFHIGFDALRNRLRHDPGNAMRPWMDMPALSRKSRRVV
ncbi:IS4 family transposase [Paracoccus sp. (in: a-proteobacteria)]|uniref:IS4 family transposase n=1 Tax=Paracoccus sp. TaxID=267 RepID=UPI003A89CE69